MAASPLLRIKDRPHIELVGTLETIRGVAYVHSFDPRTGEIEYSGSTEVYWDGQKPVLRDGKTVWVDEFGNEHALANDEIEVVQTSQD